MSRALILTYHAVDRGHGPLFCDPDLFAEHLDVIVASGARATTVTKLAAMLRAGTLDDGTVAITFDDGIASVARIAAPLLDERDLEATLFCVAGHLGGRSNWPSARPETPTLELATVADLVGLAERGWEIGAHGMTHAPLVSDAAAAVQREVVDAHRLLEDVVGAPVRSYAYPYGALSSTSGRTAVRATYESACTTRLGIVRPGASLHELPRVDVHYVSRPHMLAQVLAGRHDAYLAARGVAARARRLLRKDYFLPPDLYERGVENPDGSL